MYSGSCYKIQQSITVSTAAPVIKYSIMYVTTSTEALVMKIPVNMYTTVAKCRSITWKAGTVVARGHAAARAVVTTGSAGAGCATI
jgi:hypothetical protein